MHELGEAPPIIVKTFAALVRTVGVTLVRDSLSPVVALPPGAEGTLLVEEADPAAYQISAVGDVINFRVGSLGPFTLSREYALAIVTDVEGET